MLRPGTVLLLTSWSQMVAPWRTRCLCVDWTVGRFPGGSKSAVIQEGQWVKWISWSCNCIWRQFSNLRTAVWWALCQTALLGRFHGQWNCVKKRFPLIHKWMANGPVSQEWKVWNLGVEASALDFTVLVCYSSLNIGPKWNGSIIILFQMRRGSERLTVSFKGNQRVNSKSSHQCQVFLSPDLVLDHCAPLPPVVIVSERAHSTRHLVPRDIPRDTNHLGECTCSWPSP